MRATAPGCRCSSRCPGGTLRGPMMRNPAWRARERVPGSGNMASYAFVRGLDHASIMEIADRVAWTVDQVFGGRRFDGSKPIVPASWVGTEALGFLESAEQLTLNHCRAFSYVHLLG